MPCKLVGLLIGVIGTAIFVCLLVTKSIPATLAGGLILACMATGVIVAKLDSLTEFNLKKTHAKFKESIEGVSSGAFDAFERKVARKVQQQQDRLAEAIQNAEKLAKSLEIQTICADAMNGSRPSYEKLRAMVDDLTGEQKEQIQRQVHEVQRKFSPFIWGPYPASTPEINGVVVNLHHPETLEAQQSHYHEWNAQARKGFFDTIALKEVRDALPFVLQKIRVEQDLDVCSAAQECLLLLTGIEPENLLLDLEFWEKYAKDNGIDLD